MADCGILSGLASQARTLMTQEMLLSNCTQTELYRHWPSNLDGGTRRSHHEVGMHDGHTAGATRCVDASSGKNCAMCSPESNQ